MRLLELHPDRNGKAGVTSFGILVIQEVNNLMEASDGDNRMGLFTLATARGHRY